MRPNWSTVLLVAGALGAASVMSPLSSSAATTASTARVARYDHIFVIVEENHGFHDVIGNPAAPNLNALARQFGVATDYFGVTHPSEPNYVALLGGSPFGIADDNPYYLNSVAAPSLVSQLDAAHVSWRAYLQGSPHPGFRDICYPANCNGAPDKDPLYVSKHDAIQNFSSSRNPTDWSRQVPIQQLGHDLATGAVPRFGYVIPDECHDEHGDPPYCIDSGNPFDPQDQRLVALGDSYLGNVVHRITSAPFWARGNNAIAVVYDEGDDNAGCCDARPGGGQVAAVVVTSHGPRHVADATPSNHYSLLASIQQSFGLGCLQNTCDTTHVKALPALFAITGAPAIATAVEPVPNLATPTPTPLEPSTHTVRTATSDGFTVVPGARHGMNDNSLGAVSGAPGDVWAVGNFLPDTSNSNQDATLSLATHWDGRSWTAVPTPNVGPNFNTFFGVATATRQAWAVGVHLDEQYRDRGLIEHWDGARWSVVEVPQPSVDGEMFFSASATSTRDVWAVGDRRDGERFVTLAEHFDGNRWQVVTTPNPGGAGDELYGVAATSANDVWAVGQQLDDGHDGELIGDWDGHHWTVLPPPTSSHDASTELLAVAVDGATVWAVGQTQDDIHGTQPLIERIEGGHAQRVALPVVASRWATLYGIAVASDGPYAVGDAYDAPSATDHTLVLHGTANGWQHVDAPSPGSGDNILGGATAIGDALWTVGSFDDGGSRLPLTEFHTRS